MMVTFVNFFTCESSVVVISLPVISSWKQILGLECAPSRVGKRAVRILRKTDPEGKQIIDDRPASRGSMRIHALLQFS